jgi:hypothetical protein
VGAVVGASVLVRPDIEPGWPAGDNSDMEHNETAAMNGRSDKNIGCLDQERAVFLGCQSCQLSEINFLLEPRFLICHTKFAQSKKQRETKDSRE